MYGSYKLTLKLLRYNPYFPCLLCIAKGNHQESDGGGGGKAPLYSEKSALNAATSAIRPSKSCPWAAWVVIMVDCTRGLFDNPSSLMSATVPVGSTGLCSAWSPPVVDCTRGLFDDPTLGPTLLFCAVRCLRKVAPIGAVMWINSREGKFRSPTWHRTL